MNEELDIIIKKYGLQNVLHQVLERELKHKDPLHVFTEGMSETGYNHYRRALQRISKNGIPNAYRARVITKVFETDSYEEYQKWFAETYAPTIIKDFKNKKISCMTRTGYNYIKMNPPIKGLSDAK